jgi:hypothetical protein
MNKSILFFITIFSIGFKVQSQNLYFPPLTGGNWETISPNTLNWDINSLNSLDSFLAITQSKGCIILKDGKIVLEKYYGTFTKDSNWYWASAGKTLTTTIVGIAQQENLIQTNNKVSNYLKRGEFDLGNVASPKIIIGIGVEQRLGLFQEPLGDTMQLYAVNRTGKSIAQLDQLNTLSVLQSGAFSIQQ